MLIEHVREMTTEKMMLEEKEEKVSAVVFYVTKAREVRTQGNVCACLS